MAESKKVTLKLGKDTLDVPEPTYEGITALEALGWKVESGTKPGKPRKQAKAGGGFDEAKAREEIAASLRAEIEAEVRAEYEKAAAEAARGDGKTPPADKK